MLQYCQTVILNPFGIALTMANKFLSRIIIVVCVAVLFKIKLTSPPCKACVTTTSLRPSYDFIVVGGGTAGSIIAAELATNPNHSVLLVETGGYTNTRAASLQSIPGIIGCRSIYEMFDRLAFYKQVWQLPMLLLDLLTGITSWSPKRRQSLLILFLLQ